MHYLPTENFTTPAPASTERATSLTSAASANKIETDKGEFKTPTLRNVALSRPYMHDGSLKTLKDVVDFYAGGGNSNPYLDKEIKATAAFPPRIAQIWLRSSSL